MRCGCPICGRWMIQSDSNPPACVCPECGTRCSACMGTNSVLSKEELQEMGKNEHSFLYVPLETEESELLQTAREEAPPYPLNRNFYHEPSFEKNSKKGEPHAHTDCHRWK